jgi:hypothetical protein
MDVFYHVHAIAGILNTTPSPAQLRKGRLGGDLEIEVTWVRG